MSILITEEQQVRGKNYGRNSKRGKLLKEQYPMTYAMYAAELAIQVTSTQAIIWSIMEQYRRLNGVGPTKLLELRLVSKKWAKEILNVSDWVWVRWCGQKELIALSKVHDHVDPFLTRRFKYRISISPAIEQLRLQDVKQPIDLGIRVDHVKYLEPDEDEEGDEIITIEDLEEDEVITVEDLNEDELSEESDPVRSECNVRQVKVNYPSRMRKMMIKMKKANSDARRADHSGYPNTNCKRCLNKGQGWSVDCFYCPRLLYNRINKKKGIKPISNWELYELRQDM